MCTQLSHEEKKNVLIEDKHDMLSHQTFEFFFSGGGGVGYTKFKYMQATV